MYLFTRSVRLGGGDLAGQSAWVASITEEVRIGVVGKYIELQDAYKSIYESLVHAGASNDTKVEIVKVDAENNLLVVRGAVEAGGPDAPGGAQADLATADSDHGVGQRTLAQR